MDAHLTFYMCTAKSNLSRPALYCQLFATILNLDTRIATSLQNQKEDDIRSDESLKEARDIISLQKQKLQLKKT